MSQHLQHAACLTSPSSCHFYACTPHIRLLLPCPASAEWASPPSNPHHQPLLGASPAAPPSAQRLSCRGGALCACLELTFPFKSPLPLCTGTAPGLAYMRRSPSPPQEAEHIRHQQLTPESPRPQNVPSPANIPILVEQMDLNFNGPSYTNDTPQAHTPSTFASTPYYADQPAPSLYQNVGSQGAGGAAPSGFSLAAALGGMGTQAQDAAPQPSGQDVPSARPFSHDSAYAAQSAPAQSAQGAHYQTEAHAGATVDVQALLDSLTPAANNAPAGHYAASPVSAQSHYNASSLPAATTNLPPRPPAQDKPVTHPNYSPNDDIRSFHPHSQRAPNTQQRGNGQLPSMNLQRQEFPAVPRSGAQSPTTPGQASRQPANRSVTPDDEDIRWPPEINRKYEEFIEQERKFVTEGQWDQFPVGSRLFIGELESVAKAQRASNTH